MMTTRNRAIRKIWNLPPYSHRILLTGLNEGRHMFDYVCTRMMRMYKCMSENLNEKTIFLMELSQHDTRTIIRKNREIIFKCDGKLFKENDLQEHEQTIL